MLPFNKVPRSVLTSSKKKVFAHYFTPFPLSINNKKPQDEYYRTHYLNPLGENGKYLNVGGYLRQKPLDRASIPAHEHFQITDLRHEIRLAAAMGIDGFAVDILNDTGTQWTRVLNMLDVAHEEFPDFSILLMPDMMSLSNPDNFVTMIQALAKKPAAYRAEDGRLIIAPYMASKQTPQWWGRQLQALKNRGINAALLPVYQGWRNGLQDFIDAYPNTYKQMLYGVSDWGPRTPTGASNLKPVPAEVQQYGVRWMAPVAPQDMRPKSSKYTEAGNSETLRRTWLSAIEGDADWVQIITWNDYSETTEVAPSTGTHYAFYDLVTYFTTWFKNGRPPIVRDTLYAFYREHNTQAAFVSSAVQAIPMAVANGEEPQNQIELLGFLKEPGILQIEIGGKVYRKQANAGVTGFKVPLQSGRPVFKLIRNNAVVKSMTGSWNITSVVSIQNLMYHGMSSRRLDPARNTTALSWPWRYGQFTSHQKLTELTDGGISPFARVTNLNPTQYIDHAGSTARGVGYSFISPSSASRMRITFDAKIENTGRTSNSIIAALANTGGRKGGWFELNAAANRSLAIAKDSYTGNVQVALPYGQWHRVEVTVSELVAGGDKFSVTVTDTKGTTKSLTGTTFQDDIENIGQLIFNANSPGVRIVLDNVSANKL